MPWTPVPRLCPTPWTVKGLVKRKGRDCGEYCSRRRCRASSSSSSEFSSSDARTMSMQMIGRRSISVPGCDQNFPATGGSGGSSALSPRPPPPIPPPPPHSLGPARDKRGPAPVDNGPMALRMQAQGSALFEFVAFCLCLSAATPPSPPPSFSSHTCPRPARSAPRRSVPPVIRSSPDPLPTHPRGSILQIAIANLPALCLLALFPFGPSASPLNLLESVNRGGLGGSGDAWLFADILLIDGIFSIGTEQRRRNKKTGGDARRRRRRG